jgi:hypothetical protein
MSAITALADLITRPEVTSEALANKLAAVFAEPVDKPAT